MATIVKTKDLMIEVARQLFARVGFTNTTMNDIADASNKGRRTLYTYFRNKDEIFHAVIERELERLWHDLELIRRLPATPEEKILTLLLTHLDKIKDLVLRNGSLRAEFFRDIWLVENSRSAFDEKEIQQLQDLLEEGKQSGLFSRHTSCRTSSRGWKSPSSAVLTDPKVRSRKFVPPCVTSSSSVSDRAKSHNTNPTFNSDKQ